MGTTSKPLKDLLQLVDEGDLILPEIQRDFVWKPRNVMLLFDSLYRGLPIGHMLVWRTKLDVTTRKFRHLSNGGMRGFYGYLLDGQQRLTAISLVRHRDGYNLMFSLWPEDEEKPDNGRFSWASRRTEGDPWYISVADVLTSGFSPLSVLDRLKKEDDGYDTSEHGDVVHASLAKLKSILDYHIGITEFESNSYSDATELFIRFNSTGTRLNKTDLAMAELALVVPKIVSEAMGEASIAYSGFPFTRHFLIQCLVAVHTGKLSLRNPAEVWEDGQEKQINVAWEKTARALGLVVEFVTGTVHWGSQQWVPSINALIPLLYISAHGPKLTHAQRILARKWLLLVCFHRYFSGSGHAELDRILRKLQSEPTVERLFAITKRSLPKVSADDFDTNQRSGPAMSLYISLLRDQGAKDWGKKTGLDGTVIGHNADLQVHHFFPALCWRKTGWIVPRSTPSRTIRSSLKIPILEFPTASPQTMS